MPRAKKNTASTVTASTINNKKYHATVAWTKSGSSNTGSSLDSAFNNRNGTDILDSNSTPFISPYLSTDMLELPRSKREVRRWYRHYYRNDPIVGPAIDLHSEIPLSKVMLTMPEAKDHETAKKILRFFERMVEKIGLFKKLLSVAHEYNLIGDVYVFSEWDEETRAWSRITVLDPDTIEVKHYPFTDFVEISLMPDTSTRELVQRSAIGDRAALDAIKSMPKDIVDYIKRGDNIPLDTDPYSGSHVYHLARKMSDYEDSGTSILDRVLRDLLELEKLRQAQTMIASRNMTPKRIVWAENISAADVEELREQIEASMIDPDYSIVTNYQLNWEEIGANDRLLDLTAEYERISSRLLAGLGITADLLTGESTFSGTRITLEVLNTRYLLFREIMQNFVEEVLFKPVAKANGFIEKDDDGVEKLLYPKLAFRRLALRDSADVFDSLFQLYNKGSIDIATILDLFNIDPVSIRIRLEQDMGTVNDATFNEVLRNVYQSVGQKIVENTDVAERLSKYLRLEYKENAGGGEEGLGGLGGGMGGDLGGMEGDLGGDLGDLEGGGDLGGELGGDLGGEGGGMGGEMPSANVETPKGM